MSEVAFSKKYIFSFDSQYFYYNIVKFKSVILKFPLNLKNTQIPL